MLRVSYIIFPPQHKTYFSVISFVLGQNTYSSQHFVLEHILRSSLRARDRTEYKQ